MRNALARFELNQIIPERELAYSIMLIEDAWSLLEDADSLKISFCIN